MITQIRINDLSRTAGPERVVECQRRWGQELPGLYGILFIGMLFLVGCQKETPNTFLINERVAPAVQSETFAASTLRLSETPVDVVWIVDDSGSMARHQQAVADNAEIFMRTFRRLTAPWQVAIVTTSDRQSGNNPVRLGFSSSRNLNNRTPDPVGFFRREMVAVGTNGSASERAFSGLRDSISSAPNYLRSGVPLVLIFMSDAEEQSFGINPSAFYDELLALKGGRKDFIQVFGIFVTPAWCPGMPTDDSVLNWPNSRYKTFFDRAGGVAVPLCNPLGNTLSDIGRSIVRVAAARIPLKVRPRLSTLKVFHKGVELPGGPADQGGLWYFDYDYNAIVFYDLSFANDPNDSLSVSYRPEDGSPE